MTKKMTILFLASILITGGCMAQETDSDALIGTWEAHRIAGPVVQGDLWIRQDKGEWWVDVAGYQIQASHSQGRLSFEVPDGLGSFRGMIDAEGKGIKGHWTQPGILNNGMPHASPVVLDKVSDQLWRGEIHPLLDEWSVYLPVWKREDGKLGAFMRNPDRGFGVFYNIDRVELVDDHVNWIGRYFRYENERTLAQAAYQPGQMSVNIRGNQYDLRLSEDDSDSHFYARGKNPKPYRYHAPVHIPEDNWPTGNLTEAGFDTAAIGKFIDDVILPPADSIDDVYIHGFLMARSGRLVLEEYFHGFHRDKAHDTRSASKSLAAVLAGAVIQAGYPLSEDSPVFETILGSAYSNNDADPRRTNMKLKHLMSMSSGLDCDDGDDASPGNENTLQSQSEQPDWYRYMMDLSMIREPGEKAVYCSGAINLVGAVLSAASGRTLEELIQTLIAEPLQINHYYLNLSPTGEPYFGGGIYWQPRDFMKLGQLMLNGGIWNGKRVLSKAFVEQSVTPMYQMSNKGYGYAWWTIEYPYKGRSVKAFFAAGNGGQIVMGLPELDLLVAFFAGNYSHRTLFRIQEEFVPQYILPALR